jgi:hypothetical protein
MLKLSNVAIPIEEQLRNCQADVYRMIKQNSFLEQFADHVVIAISFYLLGMLINQFIIYLLSKSKVRIDHKIPKGTIMRLPIDGTRYYVINPKSFMQFIDIQMLCIWDKGKDKYVDKHDKKRIRILTIVLLTLVTLLFISGFLLLFSATAFSTNPFDYME